MATEAEGAQVTASSFAGVAREVSRLRQELADLREKHAGLQADHQSCLDDDETWAARWRTKYEKAEAECRALAEARDQLAQEVERYLRERLELHALLTGKGEMAWAMAHPDGELHTELGQAVGKLQHDLGDAQRQISALRDEVTDLERQLTELGH